MTRASQSPLPWKIEAFREYLTYETLQQAAAVLSIYEGEIFDVRNPRIIEMQNLLAARTGKDAWIPNRSVSNHINWNAEGDVTRNKGRVFTSMLILTPKEWCDDKVQLTPFGKALGAGRVERREFYDFIITRFRYPHPAWAENWDAWVKAERTLYPFAYLLQTLMELYRESSNDGFLSVQEVADYLYVDPDHAKVASHARDIIAARSENRAPILQRSDQIHRKIGDLVGFLCLSPYCYFRHNHVHLNLIGRHSKQLAHFWERRDGDDTLESLSQLCRGI
jgi:hypothetical protein